MNQSHTLSIKKSFSPKRRFALITMLLIAATAFPALGAVRPFQPEIPSGGRAVAIAVKPDNPDRILVAAESGGMFKSDDRGLNWTHVDTLPLYALWDVAYSPDDPNIALVASNFDHLGPQPLIWRSSDGGTTWAPTATSQPSDPKMYGLAQCIQHFL